MPCFTYSKHGGLSFEKILKEYPESLKKVYIDTEKGVKFNEFKNIADDLGCRHKASTLSFILRNMYECFRQRDLQEVTLNPLALTMKDEIKAIGCRIEVDDSAVFRQQELFVQ